MSSLSVRGIDAELAEALKRRARESEKSVNQLVVEILRNSVGLNKERKFTKIHTDLDRFLGTWSEDEHRLVQDKIDAERRVDPELWK